MDKKLKPRLFPDPEEVKKELRVFEKLYYSILKNQPDEVKRNNYLAKTYDISLKDLENLLIILQRTIDHLSRKL